MNMSDFDFLQDEKKNQILVLVEGDSEKEEFFSILLRCFPEISISEDNIHIFRTNIYEFNRLIEEEYNSNWFEYDDIEVDVPYLISKKNNISPMLDKRHFSDIIMVFDYERQDTFFSEEDIEHLQKRFNSSTGEGILYINYPMYESLFDMHVIPDKEFMERIISSNYNGNEYKNRVKSYSSLINYFDIYDYLYNKVGNIHTIFGNEINYKKFIDELSFSWNVEEILNNLGKITDSEAKVKQFAHKTNSILKNKNVLKLKGNYWDCLRYLFIEVAKQNIIKAWDIQEGIILSNDSDIHDIFSQLDYSKILNIQNEACSDKEKSFIWVLCTCLFIIAEYKFFWK